MLIRSFIALYPDPVAREEMGRYVACLRGRERGVRWEQAEKIHVTMKFLGDVEARMLEGVAEGLRAGIPSLALPAEGMDGTIDTVGGFPNSRRPRIVWLGFSRAPAGLDALHALVEDVCVANGAAREDKHFTPHFTIGRARQGTELAGLENVLHDCSFHDSPTRFTRLRIMESRLTPQGAIHTERHSISLTPGE